MTDHDATESAAATAPAIGRVALPFPAGDPPTREVPIHAVRLGCTVAFDPSAGVGTGKVRFSELTFSRPVDSASPRLLMATASGQALDGVSVHLFRSGTTDVATRYQLHDVRVTGVEVHAGAATDGQAVETVSLQFRRVEMSYRDVNGTQIDVGWDLQDNVPM